VQVKPRVVFLDHVAQLSGAELALLRLLPAMTEIDPHVIVAEDGPLVAKFLEAGIPCEVLPINPRTGTLRKERVSRGLPLASFLDTAGYALRLAHRLRELEADIVHTNSLKAHLYGGVAARLARRPQVWHTRDRIAPDYLPAAAVRLVRTAVHHLPTAVIANSSATLSTLTFDKGPRRVLPSPVVLNDPVLRTRSNRLPHDAFTVGIVGRLAPWKGQDVFLRAFAKAFSGGSEQAVVIGSSMFGETEFAESLPALADELGIGGRVRFTGFLEDVRSELSAMDALVHSSIVPEPFGQVVIEGMAAKLPVVAAKAGGPMEIIEDGATGLLTEVGDVDDLAVALRRLADDPALRKKLGSAARRASEQYAPELIARQLTDLYTEVLLTRERRRHRKRRPVSSR
jgi:glycosyltransferase involved in cell wall biosynthesis